VATMANVPAGAYVVYAKTYVVRTGAWDWLDWDAYVRCTLDAGGGNTDVAEAILWRATLHLQVVTTLASSGSIGLRCRRVSSGAPSAVARQTTIMAVSVGSVTRTAVSG
jgi:hypothetical protein